MFNYTGSPYSPFFTSGFLSESSPASSHSSSRSASPVMAPGPRRGSLPTDTTQTQSPTVESSTYYSALQPQRDVVEYRSFLSLDLAESQTLRTVSLRRQETASSMSRRLPPICTKTFTHNSNSSRSSSRSRTIPSPKPAPISSLPDLPPLFLSSPRASTSQLPSPLPLSSPTLPSSPSPEPQERLSAFQFPPRSVVASTSTLTVSQSHSAAPSSKPHTRSASRTTVSTVSTSHRKSNRSDALACLEGRSKSAQRVPYKKVARNFMSMSDDEDEDEDSAEGDADDELDSNEGEEDDEEEERVHRISHKLDDEELVLARLRLLDSDDDDESILVPIYAPKTAPILHSFPAPPPLPIFSSPSRPQSDAASSPRRTRWGQGNPLVSFIDFKDPLQQQQHHHQRVSFMDLDYSNALNKDVDAMGSSWNSWRGLGGVTVS